MTSLELHCSYETNANNHAVKFYISNYSRSETGLVFIPAFPFDDVGGGQNGKSHNDERSLLNIILSDSLSAGNEELFKVLGSLEPVHSMRKRNEKQRRVGGDEDDTSSHKCFWPIRP